MCACTYCFHAVPVTHMTFVHIAVNGDSKMVMIVSLLSPREKRASLVASCLCYHTNEGETLEKATRVLSDEERTLMNQEFVGKNGEKRRIEVRRPLVHNCCNSRMYVRCRHLHL